MHVDAGSDAAKVPIIAGFASAIDVAKSKADTTPKPASLSLSSLLRGTSSGSTRSTRTTCTPSISSTALGSTSGLHIHSVASSVSTSHPSTSGFHFGAPFGLSAGLFGTATPATSTTTTAEVSRWSFGSTPVFTSCK